jgi:hypothetical protein
MTVLGISAQREETKPALNATETACAVLNGKPQPRPTKPSQEIDVPGGQAPHKRRPHPFAGSEALSDGRLRSYGSR